jgi:hypothetical protein
MTDGLYDAPFVTVKYTVSRKNCSEMVILRGVGTKHNLSEGGLRSISGRELTGNDSSNLVNSDH